MTETGAARTEVDLVVYGATAGGVVAATIAARLGMKVALVDPTRHVGGMMSGGLTRSDVERQERLIGGSAHAFFEAVRDRYRPVPGSPLEWRFEPKVADEVFRAWLDDAGVLHLPDWRLQTVVRTGGTVAEILSDDQQSVTAPYFVDASYEGDLLANAGVPYAVGREGRSRHGESLAGRLEMLPNPHQFTVPIEARLPTGELLPHVQPYDTLGPLGHGDGKVQSYCYRLCLTDDPAEAIPFSEPEGYDPEDYVLVGRYAKALGETATPRHFMGLGRLMNAKLDINSDGPVSTNLLGGSWGYAEADHAGRERIAERHLRWAQGLLFFLAHDPNVPQSLRGAMAGLGLPEDEFPETGHWPPQLYVREARRMRGEYVLTQHDVQGGRNNGVADAIGWGGYNIDIREVQWVAAPVSRFPDVTEEVLTEGYLSVPVDPYPIPYGALLPRRQDCDNLLVSTCISATHIAFASFRMEPQFMIAGQAAGTAAALAADTGVAVHDLDVGRLRTLLRRQGQVVDAPT